MLLVAVITFVTGVVAGILIGVLVIAPDDWFDGPEQKG